MSAVLLVEDNLLLCKMEARHISTAFPDIALYTAHTGTEALVAAEAAPPDAVVMDCRIPGCACLDLLDGILRVSPDAAIIIASADPPKELTGRSYREKVFGILEKPFETEELIDVLQRAFGARGKGGLDVKTALEEQDGAPAGHFNRHGMINTLTGILILVKSFGKELEAEAEHASAVREIIAEYVPKLEKLVRGATAQVKQGRE